MLRSEDAGELLTMAEAARVAGISRQAIESAVKSGAITHTTISIPAKRIRLADVLAYRERTGGTPGRPRKD